MLRGAAVSLSRGSHFLSANEHAIHVPCPLCARGRGQRPTICRCPSAQVHDQARSERRKIHSTADRLTAGAAAERSTTAAVSILDGGLVCLLPSAGRVQPRRPSAASCMPMRGACGLPTGTILTLQCWLHNKKSLASQASPASHAGRVKGASRLKRQPRSGTPAKPRLSPTMTRLSAPLRHGSAMSAAQHVSQHAPLLSVTCKTLVVDIGALTAASADSD